MVGIGEARQILGNSGGMVDTLSVMDAGER